MERKIFHGNLQPADLARALIAEFNQGNLRAHSLGEGDKVIVQVGTRPDSPSGGQTAMTVTIQSVEDGVMAELGQQAWLGIAASIGATAFSAIRNPFSLLGRLDDLAQDVQSLQMGERIWAVISQTARAAGASADLSENLKRVTCEYCHVANLVGAASCSACGAPMGNVQPVACRACGFAVKANEKVCPNCGKPL
ncbi:MAG: zinc ribbon domain-containing protein [Anaerolineales bacterium]|nr:zinc ribbon domain-containing protein [Anaerolineales bacterium]